MDGWDSRWIDEWVDGLMEELIDRSMDGWVDCPQTVVPNVSHITAYMDGHKVSSIVPTQCGTHVFQCV